MESEVAVDAEVEVGLKLKWALAYIIYTTCKSCYLVDSVCTG